MKVLYLVTDDWYFLSHRLPLARAARDHGCEVVVATAPGSRVAEIEAEGFTHRPIKFHRTIPTQARNLSVVRDIVKLYRREEPELVHHVSFLPIFYGALAAERARVPATVNAVTGLGHAFMGGSLRRRTLRWLLERAYRKALERERSLTVFQNEEDQHYFVSRGLVSESRSIRVPGSGVDTSRFESCPESDPQGTPLILHASRMLYSKGVAETVEACRILRRRGIGHRLVLAGRTHTTNPESIPEARLFGWQEEGVAEWFGHHEDMPELIRASHVVCLPTAYREGVPMVLLEAAATGRPIVTTDVPGCRDVVEDGLNGFLVPPRDPRRLADALAALLHDSALRARMGRVGRERVTTSFSKEIIVRQTLACYRQLVLDRWPMLIQPQPAEHGAERVSL